ISAWNWNMDGQDFYDYTSNSSTPSYVRDGNWDIVQEYVALPGGVSVTIKPQQTTVGSKFSYNLPNLQGHTLFTTNGTGTNTSNGSGPMGSFSYDAFGNVVPASGGGGNGNPQNLDFGSFGYAGAAGKITESSISLSPVQMGDRVYLPTLGRFASTDPVPGG